MWVLCSRSVVPLMAEVMANPVGILTIEVFVIAMELCVAVHVAKPSSMRVPSMTMPRLKQ